ncbi:protein kinase regulator [Fragilaria crotonensis]|nr:protein kinase regulator [Fragilaria crotonensis]
MSIQRILDTGDRITQPIVQQRLDSPEVQQPIEQPLRHENSALLAPIANVFAPQSTTKATKTHKLSMLEQRAAMLSYTTPWVIDFLQSRPNDALLAVPRDFLGDGFNLVHLPPLVERFVGSVDLSFPLYKAALRLILSNEQLSDIPPLVQQAAEILYALIHGRFVTSPRGLDTLRRTLMHHKEIFGKCPRPSCRECLCFHTATASQVEMHSATVFVRSSVGVVGLKGRWECVGSVSVSFVFIDVRQRFVGWRWKYATTEPYCHRADYFWFSGPLGCTTKAPRALILNRSRFVKCLVLLGQCYAHKSAWYMFAMEEISPHYCFARRVPKKSSFSFTVKYPPLLPIRKRRRSHDLLS